MLNRRNFIRISSLAAVGLNSNPLSLFGINKNISFNSKRPEISKRKFVSEAIDSEISSVKKNIADEELGWIFENCFPNTLDTTVKFDLINGKPDTFVITGDIDAMWLRDSSAQVWPYLPYVNQEKKLQELIKGVINRQTKCILIDPYANAFNYGPTGSYWEKDITAMKPELHERKWEIDSLCYPIRLAYGYWKISGDASCFDDNWKKSIKLIVQTFKEQQRIDGPGPYSFKRLTDVPSDTLYLNGYGNPTKPIGLIHSMFRPSDDACIYPFLIPSNLFAAVSLEQAAEICEVELNDKSLAGECRDFSSLIRTKVKEYAVSDHLSFNQIYPFEIDGFGNRLFMDDANIPSLLSLPYLGCVKPDDPNYLSTRKFILSDNNPYYFKGSVAEGIGGPHIGKEMIWPLSIIMQAMTSNNDEEILRCLTILKTTHAGTGFMHESFHVNDSQKFTRSWFAWANTLFGEMILKIYNERKYLLLKQIK